MTLWAIVPVKPMRRGKSRLAEVLTQDEREDLNRRMLSHTLETLTAVPEIEHVLVISRDQAALTLARSFGARTIQESGAPHLNTALARATAMASRYTTRGVLILPADLPLVTTGDVRALLEKAVDPPVVVVAPDRHSLGTNALVVCPTGLIEYEFGPHSFERHCKSARQTGARLDICYLPTLALDVDLPEDLELVSEKLESLSKTWPV
jgi:2-phospho-L-lactate guanylyltransferase